MRWNDYRVAWKSQGQDFGSVMRGMSRLIKTASGNLLRATKNTGCHFANEKLWEEAGRPYYDVYPGIVEAFSHVDLDKINCEHVGLPLEQLVLRFQQGYEIHTEVSTVKSAFVCFDHAFGDPNTRAMLVAFDDGTTVTVSGVSIPNHQSMATVLRPGTTVQAGLLRGRAHRSDLIVECEDSEEVVPFKELDDEAFDKLYRLIICLGLLQKDSGLIEQEPLESDRLRWEETHDPKYLEKAERRGKRCWSIGRHLETAPGFRRPHFAIRWMGKGQPKTPVLRPIRGCLIRKQRVEEIPTGYLDDEIQVS
jgi:hypothetical protein